MKKAKAITALLTIALGCNIPSVAFAQEPAYMGSYWNHIQQVYSSLENDEKHGYEGSGLLDIDQDGTPELLCITMTYAHDLYMVEIVDYVAGKLVVQEALSFVATEEQWLGDTHMFSDFVYEGIDEGGKKTYFLRSHTIIPMEQHYDLRQLYQVGKTTEGGVALREVISRLSAWNEDAGKATYFVDESGINKNIPALEALAPVGKDVYDTAETAFLSPWSVSKTIIPLAYVGQQGTLDRSQFDSLASGMLPEQKTGETQPSGSIGKTVLEIDGALVEKAEIVLKDGRTLVPIRLVSENLGAKTNWEGATQKITLEKEGTEIIFHVNQLTAKVNGVEMKLDVAPVIINGKTYVPLRFIGDGFGVAVGYEKESSYEKAPMVWITTTK